MDLSRKQELYLINLGLKSLVEKTIGGPKPKVKKVKGHKWTKAQRKKFINTMKKVWEAKKNGKK